MQNTDLVQALRFARGRIMDEPTRDLMTLAAERLEARPEPETVDDALAYELPPLVVDRIVHELAQMPYAGGLLTFDDDRTRVSQLVTWLEQLRVRLEGHAKVDEGREQELVILLHQRHTIRAFLGLPTEEAQS